MKVWIGYWLMLVAVIHTVAMFIFFPAPLADIFKRGVFDSIGNESLLGAVAWFGLFGVLIFIVGMAVNSLERSAQGVPVSMAWAILALTVLGIVLMPASGFWLALPAVVGILFQQRQLKSRAA